MKLFCLSYRQLDPVKLLPPFLVSLNRRSLIPLSIDLSGVYSLKTPSPPSPIQLSNHQISVIYYVKFLQ